MEQQRPFVVRECIISDTSGFRWRQTIPNGLIPSNQCDGVGVERQSVEARSMFAGEAFEMIERSLLFKDGGVALQCMARIEDARTTAG